MPATPIARCTSSTTRWSRSGSSAPWAEAAMALLLDDLRSAVRRLRRAPGFTAAAVICLALGIGANTAIFSVINAVLLRPLPYPQADRVMMVWEARHADQVERNNVAPYNFLPWKSESGVFQQLAAVFDTRVGLT